MALFDTIRAGASGAAEDFVIERSLRFNRDDDAYFDLTPSGAGSNQMTFAFWVKRTKLGQDVVLFSSGEVNARGHILFNSDDKLRCQPFNSSGANAGFSTDMKFRDVGAWYHIVISFNNSAYNDMGSTVNVYVNGVSVTFTTDNSSTPTGGNRLNDSQAKHIGQFRPTSGSYFDGYLAEFNFIDGQVLTPSSFAETNEETGQWIPKNTSGLTFGTEGYRLQFLDNSGVTATTIGKDTSGNGNNWTPNNFSVTAGTNNDSLTDTPTNNFCTLNHLDKSNSADTRDGNLTLYTDANDQAATGTFAVNSGKWYWEVDMNETEPEIGIAHHNMPLSGKSVSLPSDGQIALVVTGADSDTNHLRVNGSNQSGTGITAQSGPGTIGIALDADNKKIWFTNTSGSYFNSGNPATGANAAVDFSSTGSNYPTGFLTPFVSVYQGANKSTSINFGQRPFTYTQPTGFETLCSANLPEPTIAKGNQYFDIATWSGTGSSHNITGLNFQPDLVWVKKRSGSENHDFQDSVRGATKRLSTNVSSAESTVAGSISSFNSDGFTVVDAGTTNESGHTYVGWTWRAGTAFSNSAGSNSATIDSSGSVNTTAGFSIVQYQGNATRDQLVYHGLNAAPKWFLVKRRDGDNWIMYHGESADSNPQQYYYEFQNTDARKGANDAFMWDDIVPTSNNFGIYSDGAVNGNGSNIMAWVWSEVAGFSKFGHFTGNGNANGTFIHCGFTPRFVLVKNNDNGHDATIQDTTRSPGNVANEKLVPNSSAAETTGDEFDILSNGFKMRTSGSGTNGNGSRYIFMAFASNPFKYARAR